MPAALECAHTGPGDCSLALCSFWSEDAPQISVAALPSGIKGSLNTLLSQAHITTSHMEEKGRSFQTSRPMEMGDVEEGVYMQ